MKDSKTIIETWIDHPQRILVGGAVLGIGGFILYRFGKNIFENIQKNNVSGKAAESLEVQQATIIRSAINPSGISWMKSFDTTNASSVLATAAQITNFAEVQKAYKKLYADDLLVDLQSELSTDDYKKFMSIVNGSSTTKNAPKYAQEKELVVALKEVFVRSSPDASYHDAWYESSSGNNIIVKAKPGAFIGYATGKQQYASKNDVKFIEVGYQFTSKGLPLALQSYAGKSYTMWVSSSTNYVRKFSTNAELLKSYPNLQTEVTYKVPFGSLSGFELQMKRPVITKRATHIMDANLSPQLRVASRTLLGEYLMSLDTGTRLLLKFRTIDNTERWVNASDVQVQALT